VIQSIVANHHRPISRACAEGVSYTSGRENDSKGLSLMNYEAEAGSVTVGGKTKAYVELLFWS
jgi:hypothetical protein